MVLGFPSPLETLVLLAHPCREDIELLPVLRHGSPGDIESSFFEHIGYLLVTQRVMSILPPNDLPNRILCALGGYLVPVLRAQAAGKEELELEYSPGRLHVLAGRDPAHRGFVHVDLARYLLESQGSQEGGSLLEKRPLPAGSGQLAELERTLRALTPQPSSDSRPWTPTEEQLEQLRALGYIQ